MYKFEDDNTSVYDIHVFTDVNSKKKIDAKDYTITKELTVFKTANLQCFEYPD